MAADVQSKNKEEFKSKEKTKKKGKTVSEPLANSVEENQLESPTLITEKKVKGDVSADAKLVNGAETEKGSKDKKKKKDKTSSQGDAVIHIEDPNDTVSKKDNFLASKELREREKKDSKKRKRPTSEENGQQVADRKEDEESKRRKVENLNESEGGEQSAKTNANLGSDQLQKTSNEQTNGKTNGNLESAGEKSSVQKSQIKQQKGSVEVRYNQ